MEENSELSVIGFLQRLKSLQNLCSNTNAKYPVGLLFVGGIDGRLNKGSHAIFKYLFHGAVGKELMDGNLDPQQELLEEFVLLVQESSASVLWTHEIKSLIGKNFLGYGTVIEYLASSEDEADIDSLQRWKCSSFKRMLLEAIPRGGGLGVPIPLGYDSVQDTETWPLFQAFAMDDVVCPTGFLGSYYSVTDVTEYLDLLFRSVDSNVVSRATEITLSSVLPHSMQLVAMLDAETSEQRARVTAEDAVGPLSMLFEFSEMEAGAPVDPSLRPGLLFGPDTNQLGDAQGSYPVGWQSKTAGDNLHCVVEGCEAASGIRWCRTYFLSTGVSVALPVEDSIVDASSHAASDNLVPKAFQARHHHTKPSHHQAQRAAEEESQNAAFVHRLQALYALLWQGLRHAVRRAFSAHNDVLVAGTQIQSEMDKLMRGEIHLSSFLCGSSCGDPSLNLDRVKLKAGERLQVHVDCLDALGRAVTVEDVDDMGGSCWTYIRVSVHGIPLPGGLLGAVAIGDTFLFCPVSCQSVVPPHSQLNMISKTQSGLWACCGDAYCLTHPVPYFLALPGVGPELYSVSDFLAACHHRNTTDVMGLGEPMDSFGTGLAQVAVVTDHPLFPFLQCSLRPFSTGFVIERMTGRRCTPVWISLEHHVEAIWTVNSADLLEQALARTVDCPRRDKLDVEDGITMIFRLKSRWHGFGEINDEHNQTIPNTLTTALAPLTDQPCQYIGLFLPSNSQASTILSEARVQWRDSARLFSFDEFRGCSCFSSPATSPSVSVLRAFVQLVDGFSFEFSTSFENPSSQTAVSRGAKRVESIEEYLLLARISSTGRHDLTAGKGFLPMRCLHSLAESSILRSAGLPTVEEDNRELTTGVGLAKASAVIVVGPAGRGVQSLSLQLRSSLCARFGSNRLRLISLDLTSLEEEHAAFELTEYQDRVIERMKSIRLKSEEIGIFAVTLSSRRHIEVVELSLLLAAHCNVMVQGVISCFCGLDFEPDGFGDSQRSLGCEMARAIPFSVASSGCCDLIVVTEPSSSTGTSALRSYLERAGTIESGTSIRLSPGQHRLDEDSLDDISRKLEETSFSLLLEKPPLAAHVGLSPGHPPLRKAVFRESIGAVNGISGASALTVSLPGSTGGAWSLPSLSHFLKLLFSTATFSVVAVEDHWKVPAWSSIPKSHRSLISKATFMAKLKVFANMRCKEEKKRFQSAINVFSSQLDLASLRNRVFSVHGFLKVDLKGSELHPKPGNSKKAASLPQDVNSWVSVEACRGVVTVKLVEDPVVLDFISQTHDRGSFPNNELCIEGSFAAAERQALFSLAAKCDLCQLSPKPLITFDDLSTAQRNEVQSRCASCPLPGSWWFDGFNFVDIHGNKQIFRPDLETVSRDYLEAMNAEIAKYNSLLSELQPFL